jgi:ABC-type polysaccharide/polyol phosphate export permease
MNPRVLLAIARRDARLLMSYRAMVISRPSGILFTLALFYFVSRLVSIGRFPTHEAYFAFVAVGLIIAELVRSSLGVPQLVREELVAGTYERLELAPAGATVAILGMLLFPFAYSLLVCVLVLVVASLVFGLDVQWSTAPLGLPVGALGALAFAPLALLFAAVTLAFKQSPGQAAVLAGISLISGLYFPVDLLPEWLRWLADVQPFTPTVDLMRHVLVGSPLEGSVAGELARMVGFVVIGLPVSLLAISAARRYGRRRGTLLEY